MSTNWADLMDEEEEDAGPHESEPVTPAHKKPAPQFYTPTAKNNKEERERDPRQVRSADHAPPRSRFTGHDDRDSGAYHQGGRGGRHERDDRGGRAQDHFEGGRGRGRQDARENIRDTRDRDNLRGNRDARDNIRDNRDNRDNFRDNNNLRDNRDARGNIRDNRERDNRDFHRDAQRDTHRDRDTHGPHRDTHGPHTDNRHNRDNREFGGRDNRDNREFGGRDNRDNRDFGGRDNRDPRDNRGNRDFRDNRDNRDLRDPKDPRDPRDPRDNRSGRETRDNRDNRDNKTEVRDARDLIRNNREARDTRRDPGDRERGVGERERGVGDRGRDRDVSARLAGRLGSPSHEKASDEREIVPRTRMFHNPYSKDENEEDEYDEEEYDEEYEEDEEDAKIVISLGDGMRKVQISSSPKVDENLSKSRDNSPYRPPNRSANQETPPERPRGPRDSAHTPTRAAPKSAETTPTRQTTPAETTPTRQTTTTPSGKSDSTPTRQTTTTPSGKSESTTTPKAATPKQSTPGSAGKRRARFASSELPNRGEGEDDDEYDDEEGSDVEDYDESDTTPIVGTCQVFEKPYFRLTSRPSADKVRPQDVLESWFAVLSRNYTRKTKPYEYVSDQMKSIRQDLMVQHIENSFVVEVYEFNANVSLENKDFSEFIVCVTCLFGLYEKGIATDNQPEFIAYRILFDLMNWNFSGISTLLTTLPAELRKHKTVAHALDATLAVQAKNYYQFRKLYEGAPNKGKLIMDSMLAFIRGAIVQIVSKAYRPDISVEFMQKQLILKEKQECVAFLQNCGCALSNDQSTIVLQTGKGSE